MNQKLKDNLVITGFAIFFICIATLLIWYDETHMSSKEEQELNRANAQYHWEHRNEDWP
jgi:hypothetical protein